MVARGLARLGMLGAAAGCSGNGVASREAPAAASAPAPARDAALAPATASSATGDLQIRVVWPDVPTVARTSPGRTACGTPRAPSVAPTTTWGIPDALVIVEGAAPAVAAARLTFADCALSPRLAVGASLALTSAADRPAKLALRKRGTPEHLGDGDPISVLLPIAGHTVTTALDPGAIYEVAGEGAAPELGFVATAADGYVTDAGGHAVARQLAVGSHAVTAWLPPRAGQPARSGRGTATVVAGELAELTVTLAP